MIIKNRLYATFFIIIALIIMGIIFIPKNEAKIELENVTKFENIKDALEKSNYYIQKRYFNDSDFISNDLNHILPSKLDRKRSNIFYDKYLNNLLEDCNIRMISATKDSNCKNFQWKLTYEINSESSGATYYYIYQFCMSGNKLSESLNYKNVPLNDKWSLEIDKGISP